MCSVVFCTQNLSHCILYIRLNLCKTRKLCLLASQIGLLLRQFRVSLFWYLAGKKLMVSKKKWQSESNCQIFFHSQKSLIEKFGQRVYCWIWWFFLKLELACSWTYNFRKWSFSNWTPKDYIDWLCHTAWQKIKNKTVSFLFLVKMNHFVTKTCYNHIKMTFIAINYGLK